MAGSRRCGVARRQHRKVRDPMRLNPPSIFIFIVSVLLAILALVSKFGAIGINVPRYLPHQEYWLAMIAYLVLMVGVIAKGL
jgi:hypothetical protein